MNIIWISVIWKYPYHYPIDKKIDHCLAKKCKTCFKVPVPELLHSLLFKNNFYLDYKLENLVPLGFYTSLNIIHFFYKSIRSHHLNSVWVLVLFGFFFCNIKIVFGCSVVVLKGFFYYFVSWLGFCHCCFVGFFLFSVILKNIFIYSPEKECVGFKRKCLTCRTFFCMQKVLWSCLVIWNVKTSLMGTSEWISSWFYQAGRRQKLCRCG